MYIVESVTQASTRIGRGVGVDRGRDVFVGGASVGPGAFVGAVPQAESRIIINTLKRDSNFIFQIFLEF
jgi:hypothetical protein